ncbi:hypothetical protein NE237_010373 [Protea cynaroides]|uniref:Uncharacterized protein n=1 Tax=Protea cynaroides TaxID=273540 RepID=A0A9Q0KZF7_9MAGN|nr:hypothetical protein NE237_010373 [Protea cynaroides]
MALASGIMPSDGDGGGKGYGRGVGDGSKLALGALLEEELDGPAVCGCAVRGEICKPEREGHITWFDARGGLGTVSPSQDVVLPAVTGEPVSHDDGRAAAGGVLHQAKPMGRVGVDLGKFFGFPSMEAQAPIVGNRKDTEIFETRKGGDHQQGPRNGIGVQSNSKPEVGVRSFVQVTGGLPNLHDLPDPVVARGVTRVVLPQEEPVINVTQNQRDNDGVQQNHVGKWADAVDGNESKEGEETDNEEGEIRDINDAARIDVAGLDVSPVVAEILARTVTSSLGGSTLLDPHGHVEVAFDDVAMVDAMLEQEGGNFTKVVKKPLGPPPGCGNKKLAQMTEEEILLAHLVTLWKNSLQ